MRRGRLVLFGAATLIGAAAIGVVAWQREPPRTEAAIIDAPVFPDITPRLAAAERIEVRRHDGTVTLERRDGAWGIAERSHYPARAERVREVFTGLAELRLIEERTGNPDLFSRLGLEDVTVAGGTSQLLTVTDAQGATIAELIVGRRRIPTPGHQPAAIYVRRPGESRTYLAEGALRLDTDPMLWVEREVLDIKRQRVARVTARRAGAEPVTVVRADPAAEHAAVAEPPDDFKPEQHKVDDLPRALEWFSFNDVRPAAELASAEETGEASLVTFDGLSLTIRVVKADDKRWAIVSASWAEPAAPPPENPPEQLRTPEAAREEAERLAQRLAPWAFQIADWKADVLTYRLEDLRAAPESPS
ncbi:DUF4340 domain-containing protein [Elioraea sp.]|uniref:DUF4340 domain-containing protein n=1 Tax=Elioraea sp. TaxID=2185103 RepID=UPI003F6FC408